MENPGQDMPKMEDAKDTKMWAIVQVFGHAAYAGKVSAHAIGGCSFVRIDVPAAGDQQAFTKILGNGAIFDITPCTEEAARAAAQQMRSQPVSPLMLPQPKREYIGDTDERWTDDEDEEL